jgi:TolB-like protein/Flp pilus assembly protein TadD
MDEILPRLRKRKLVQWALAYLAVAVALVQVVDIVAQRFGWPDMLERALIIVLAIGFFVTVVLAWYHGERGAQRVTATELLFLAILLALGGGLLWWLAPGTRESESSAAAPAGGRKPHAASTDIPAKSIAVLPFENLSDEKANAYFAEGIQDEILTRIAKIGALKVISRTSTQQYAAKPGNLPEIAQQLGVANILEGSVQKAGDIVHINVQLVRAATDEHLWAESYNRKLDDIFGVEGEVAQAVADTLKVKLTGAEELQLAAKLTQNTAAYDAYLRGVALSHRSEEPVPNAERSILAFEEAVRLDPGLAVAWASLSKQHSYLYIRTDPSTRHKEAAHQALGEAIRLAPASVETKGAEGWYRYHVERDYENAKEIFQRLRAESPNDADALLALAAIARRQGDWKESARLFEQGFRVDPRNTFLIEDGFGTAFSMRDTVGMQRWSDRELAVAPDAKFTIVMQVFLSQMSGDLDHAQQLLDRVPIGVGDDTLVFPYVENAVLRRAWAPAIAVLDDQLKHPHDIGAHLGSYQFQRADLERFAGDAAAAQRDYAEARQTIRTSLAAQPDDPGLTADLAYVESKLENKVESLALARRAVAILPASRDAVDGPAYEENLAAIQAHFGDKEEALAGLQRLVWLPYDTPLTPTRLRLEPDWDNLRGDPRFDKLIADAEAAMKAASGSSMPDDK